MFGSNKIVISKEQYQVVKGVTKISGSKEFDVSYGIIEFGLILLHTLTLDKENGMDEKSSDMFNVWKSEPEAKSMSDAMMKYLSIEDKKEYIGKRDFFSFVGIHTINVASEQKDTIRGLARFTGFPERTISYIAFESGVTFMMLVSESNQDKIGDTLWEWKQDDDIMKVADQLRKFWEAGKENPSNKYINNEEA